MTQQDYYEKFKEYFLKSFGSYEEMFKAGKLMEKALSEAMHHAAMEKWYGRNQVDKDSD